MRTELDKQTAVTIANECGLLRDAVEKAGEILEYAERCASADPEYCDVSMRARIDLSLARNRENEFLRALYLVGVVGVEVVDRDCGDRHYAFDLEKATKGGAA